MTALVVFLLSVYGLATSVAILKAGRLVLHPLEALSELWKGSVWGMPWRFLSALVRCPPCLSFWIGVAGSRWVLSPSRHLVAGGNVWTAAVVDGLAACGSTWLLHVAAMRMCVGIEKLLEIEKVKEL